MNILIFHSLLVLLHIHLSTHISTVLIVLEKRRTHLNSIPKCEKEIVKKKKKKKFENLIAVYIYTKEIVIYFIFLKGVSRNHWR